MEGSIKATVKNSTRCTVTGVVEENIENVFTEGMMIKRKDQGINQKCYGKSFDGIR